VGRVLLPILGISYGIFVAESIVVGQAQQLAALTLIVIVFLAFAGMLFRMIVVSMLCVVASFALSLALLGPFNAVAVQSLIMLFITVLLCVIGSRDIEQGHRRNFLERALIEELVVRDELTGLTNRRAFYDHLGRLWQQAQRDRCNIAVLMADIDHFKKFNDSHGHQAGDAALRVTGRLLKGFARRPLDVAARYGGDEFVAVLYDIEEAAAQMIAERLRAAILESPPASTTNGNGSPITISIGVGAVMPTSRRSPEGAVQLADEALYEAKQLGRNRVVVHGAEHYRRLDTGSFRKSNATS
jgi:diguanylate cyclase (GGDEF)-like protein